MTDTVAGLLHSIWTVQVIVFILPVLTFFPRRAKYVRTGCIRARPHRGDCRRQGPPSTAMCALQPEPAAHALPTMRPARLAPQSRTTYVERPRRSLHRSPGGPAGDVLLALLCSMPEVFQQ